MSNLYPSGVSASASFMPNAAAYPAGNIVDVAKELVFKDKDDRPVTPGAIIRVLSAVIKIDQAALISGEGAYRLHFYSVTPPSVRAKNTAWARASGDLAAYRGALDLGTPVAAGGTCYVKTQFSDQQDFNLASGLNSFFGELVTVGGVTFTATARQIFLYGFLI
ncbi:hypothetical protein IVB45_17435 [Bradyrhizobium sp. 4]|uniref:hypothetical protein n=1 Tax=unclassified Bradyrhizobium TaxID=2631580 RepID=UPI001FFB2070|nr:MULTISPECIES: hypothetical protein [unclassified Bradyrhizobium]MCK1402042.1 hypothetical protein [Bradyrhizobium sp. 39]MCK1751238.1 hypothetical protein [Bradyrhizobium sp. 135]UPJ38492.1 hypothetical protein IVB45_17435 [Bradyrhizobium sp. 4]